MSWIQPRIRSLDELGFREVMAEQEWRSRSRAEVDRILAASTRSEAPSDLPRGDDVAASRQP